MFATSQSLSSFRSVLLIGLEQVTGLYYDSVVWLVCQMFVFYSASRGSPRNTFIGGSAPLSPR